MGMRLSQELERKCLELAGEHFRGTAKTVAQSQYDSEEAFMADVIRYAKRLGYKCYHTRDSRKSEAGFPDLVMILARQVVAELKMPGNKPTAAQESWLDAFRAAGVPAYVWYPSDWPAIVEALR